jgi:hypothetical protein
VTRRTTNVSLDDWPMSEVHGAAQRSGLSDDEVIETEPRFAFGEDARLISPLSGWRHILEVSRELV